MAASKRQRQQVQDYRRLMGGEATERQLRQARRCTYCFGTLPGGHSPGCRFYGGREPTSRR